MNRSSSLFVAITKALLFCSPAFCQLPTQFSGPPFPTFRLLTGPRTPPIDDYVISTQVNESANELAGVVGYDKYDFVSGSTTMKEFSQPRTVTLSINEGGIYRNTIRVFNHSTLNLNGGVITNATRGVVQLDNSTLNLNRGTIRGILAMGQSHVFLGEDTVVQLSAMIEGSTHVDADGATVGSTFPFTGTSTGTIAFSELRAISTGGAASVTVTKSSISLDASSDGTSTLGLTETDVQSLSAQAASELTMEAGTVASNVQVSGNATMALSGVSVGGSAFASDGSLNLKHVLMDGSLTAEGTANVFATDGTLAQQVSASGQSTMYLANAQIPGLVQATNQSSIRLIDSEAGKLFVSGTAEIEMTGGQIFEDLVAAGGEVILADVALINGVVSANEGAKVTISGATNIVSGVGGAGGDIFLTGGVTSKVTGAGDSFVSIRDVLVHGVASAHDTRQIVMHSG